jgi:hypothetical protein
MPREPIMTTPHARLQIAARIHFFLMKEIGTGIDVEGMLTLPHYAGEVLAMCDKARGTRLHALGQEFRRVSAAMQTGTANSVAAGPAGHSRQSQPWAADTSGFGF